jgi:hypothetical protein
MTFPRPFLRMVATGDLYGVEEFSLNLSFATVGGAGDGTPPATVPQGVLDAFSAFWTTVGVSQKARLLGIKVNEIGPDGRYTNETTTVYKDYATPVAGAGAANVAPQLALAITLRTEARRGLASAGRFFLPLPSPGLADDGRIASTFAQGVADDALVLVNALNVAMNPYRLVVASNVGEGAIREVRTVEVGRTLDTIRSRRTKFQEAHVASDVVTGFSGDGGGF